jgi:acyl-CoA synthetase (AMP-forming)/AMP-acid ligase II
VRQDKVLTESYWPRDTSEDLLELTLGDLLRTVAAEVPDRIALVDGIPDRAARRRWTYREMLAAAERTARALLGRFAPGARVAICAPNCPEWVMLQHGMSFAGITLVPINPAYKMAEIETILRSSQAVGLFHAESYRDNDLRAVVAELRSRLPGMREAITIGEFPAFLATADLTMPLPHITPDRMIQIQYTSGTTGVPKGAILHHRGVVNTSRFVAGRAGFPDGGIWVNAMPLFHIGGPVVTEIATIASRGTYVLQPGFEPGVALELIESERGNASLLVPTMILALLDHPDFAKRDLSSMQTILSGAAVVPAALVHRTKSAIGCAMTILFGQTEINGVVSQTRLDDTVEDQSETIGQPLPQVEVKIADPLTGAVQPLDVAGEICVRGYQTMHGYFGDDEATRATIGADGWLRTGDLGAMDERGYVRFTGRLKDMIVRGGMNLYPREIEDVLFDHPEVGQVSVIGLDDEKWGEIVTAVILPKNAGKPPSPDDLYEFCRARLSSHKVPAQWFVVAHYPLTASGKIQKFKLREWMLSGAIKPVPWSRPAAAPERAPEQLAEAGTEGHGARV